MPVVGNTRIHCCLGAISWFIKNYQWYVGIPEFGLQAMVYELIYH